MDSKILAFIDHLYSSMFIYRALIVYPPDYKIDNLTNCLLEKDYPVVLVTPENEEMVIKHGTKYRIYAVKNDSFEKFFTSQINLIICLSSSTYVAIKDYIKNNQIKEDNIYIFSYNTL